MKAKPLRKNPDTSLTPCEPAEATHVWLNLPGPLGDRLLRVILHGSRSEHAEQPVWTWNGDTERPTLKPSLLSRTPEVTCHTWITDGKVQFLPDSTHELAGQTLDLLEVDW